MTKIKTDESMDVKERILKAAEDLFSSRGYDATGVDRIAKKAEVTKSLIYYYFESKEKILEELISKYMFATMEEKKGILSGNPADISLIEQSMLKGFAFLSKNKRITKILLSEMLKDNIRNEYLCKMIGDMAAASTANLKSLGIEIKDDNDFAMYSFFFGLAPIITFMLLGDTWIKNNQLDRDDFTAKFVKMAIASFSNDITGIKGKMLEPINDTLTDNLDKLLD